MDSQAAERMAAAQDRAPRYYEKYGLAHDGILRCVDCQSLVTYERLTTLGSCECGCRRVKEVTTLKDAEIEQIRSSAIDFPFREEFLAEFLDEHQVAERRRQEREALAAARAAEDAAAEVAEKAAIASAGDLGNDWPNDGEDAGADHE